MRLAYQPGSHIWASPAEVSRAATPTPHWSQTQEQETYMPLRFVVISCTALLWHLTSHRVMFKQLTICEVGHFQVFLLFLFSVKTCSFLPIFLRMKLTMSKSIIKSQAVSQKSFPEIYLLCDTVDGSVSFYSLAIGEWHVLFLHSKSSRLNSGVAHCTVMFVEL